MYLTSTARTAPCRTLCLASRVHSVRVTAPAQAESVSLLRRRASTLFAAWAMDADSQATAELVVSELLTNAVLHGRDTMTLAIARTCFTLDITVTDHGETKGTVPHAEPDEHGRGLEIVGALTRDFRVEQTPSGWRARARMDLGPPPADEPHPARPRRNRATPPENHDHVED